MNEQERSLDLQLGDALAQIESLKAERDALKTALAQHVTETDFGNITQPEMRKTTRDEKIVNPGVYEVPVQVKPT